MANLKLLVVDDQNSARKFLNSLLLDFDPLVTVVEAADGKEALDIIAKESNFDLILSDIDMPNIDGIQFCKRLKSNPATLSIPVIMISTFDSDYDIERGFQAGASAYVSKTNVREKLCRTIEDTLSKAKTRNKWQILVVEDSSSIRQLIEGSLLRSGFDVTTAKNGKEAIDIMQSVIPGLILSDIIMPEMDGITLCKNVQKDPRLSSIPFVVMSVHREQMYMKRMVEYGAAAYLVKPFNMEELIILLDKILSDQFLLLLKEKEKITQERDMMIASITSLITALEARDPCTKGHSETVAHIVTEMATYTDASEEEIERLAIGAKLHDIGKIGIRDEILFKKSELTPEEYEIIKTHPVVGATILGSITSLTDSIPIMLHHHERYDGKGYPHGLQETDIPFWARMIAVADTFDAMISSRPYRGGIKLDIVLDTIRKVSGSQLCPECVEIFSKWINENEPKILRGNDI